MFLSELPKPGQQSLKYSMPTLMNVLHDEIKRNLSLSQ